MPVVALSNQRPTHGAEGGASAVAKGGAQTGKFVNGFNYTGPTSGASVLSPVTAVARAAAVARRRRRWRRAGSPVEKSHDVGALLGVPGRSRSCRLSR